MAERCLLNLITMDYHHDEKNSSWFNYQRTILIGIIISNLIWCDDFDSDWSFLHSCNFDHYMFVGYGDVYYAEGYDVRYFIDIG